ncbi:hypothetical protein YPPY05_0577, partial [Yersinia pestis PY-05]
MATRRFSARPLLVRLSATGSNLPRPRTSILLFGIPTVARVSATAKARWE